MDKIREALELALKERWEGRTTPEGESAEPSAVPAASGGRVAARIAALRAGPRSEPAPEADDAPAEDDTAGVRATAEPAQPPSAAVPARAALRQRPVPRRARPAGGPASTARAARALMKVTLDDNVLRSNLLAAAIEDHPAREACCLMQAAVLERIADSDRTWIGVTRPRSGQGKSLTAANLAISLAVDGGYDVLLIDLDLQRPSVGRLFGLNPARGLEDCLFSKAPLSEAMLMTSLEGLTLLPIRRASRSAAQVIGSPNLKKLLGDIRHGYPGHLVVANLPPLATAAHGTAFKTLVDAVVLVVDDGATREADYRRALDSVGKGKLLGTVLNRSESTD